VGLKAFFDAGECHEGTTLAVQTGLERWKGAIPLKVKKKKTQLEAMKTPGCQEFSGGLRDSASVQGESKTDKRKSAWEGWTEKGKGK